MKFIYLSLANLLVFMAMLNSVLAQPEQQHSQAVSHKKGTVTGLIVEENGQPMQYASVFVKKVSDSTTVQYGVTDAEGKFLLDNIPFGQYYVEFQYVGYHKSTSPSFTISTEQAIYKIPKYKMTDKSTALQTVEIRAQKDMLQTNLDKTVFNVSSSITANGATAVEVLEEIPSVQVDVEGNVSLRGSDNVTILVDGHSTNLTLDEIPASMIESIEVITNPSARLDPDGMAGILNVILKKKKESGINGMVSIGANTSVYKKIWELSGYNGSVSLNYRYNKINIFANYNFRSHSHRGGGEMSRTSWSNGDSTYMEQSNYNENNGFFQNANIGMDYLFNKYNTLSFSVGGDFGNMKSNSMLYSETDSVRKGMDYPIYHYQRPGVTQMKFNNYDASLNYKKTFQTQGRELTSDIYYSQRNSTDFDNYQQISMLDYFQNYYQETHTKELNRNFSAQVDFVTPIGNGGRIETGYKFSYRAVGQDYSLYDGFDSVSSTLDSTQLNNFYYSEYLNALYFIYSNTFWKKLKLQIGLRGEIANTISDLRSADTAYHFNYYNLFPTLHLKYEITPEHSLQLSYSRRVTRPNVRQLNPFVDYSDRENLSMGNPYLEPEFANSFEFGYLYNKDKTSFTFTAFYRQRTNLITRYTQIVDTTINDEHLYYTMTSYQNLNSSQNFGFEIFYGQRLFKFWKINLTGSFYRNIINSGGLIDENLSRDWAWNAGLNQTFSFEHNLDIQLNFRYRSSSLTAGSMGWGTRGIGQGRRSANYNLNLGVKKGFLKNTLVVSLNVRNLLYYIPKVRVMEIESWQGLDEPIGYYSNSIREFDGFDMSINVTYKLNNYKMRSQKISDDMDIESGEM